MKDGRMLKVLQRARRWLRKGCETRAREGVLLMISPPAVGLGWSWRSERRGREEQWQRKQNGLWNLVDGRKISGGGRRVPVLVGARLQILMKLWEQMTIFVQRAHSRTISSTRRGSDPDDFVLLSFVWMRSTGLCLFWFSASDGGAAATVCHSHWLCLSEHFPNADAVK